MFHNPKLEDKKRPVVPPSGLRSYFQKYYNVSMKDVGEVRARDIRPCPSSWRQTLAIPERMSVSSLTPPQRVLLDGSLNAVVDTNDAVMRWIDSLCSTGYGINDRTKSLIEAYLLLLCGRIGKAYTTLRNALSRASVDATIRNIQEVPLGRGVFGPWSEVEKRIDAWIEESTNKFSEQYRDENECAWVLKCFPPEYLGAFLRDRRLVVSTTSGFTWGDGVYVAPLQNALSATVFGRATVMGFIDSTEGRRVYDAARAEGVILYQQWIQYFRFLFQQATTTIHADFFNRVLRNKFRKRFDIDVVVFPPDQYNRRYVNSSRDRWFVLSDWSNTPQKPSQRGFSSKVRDCQWVAIVGEAFEKASEFGFRDLFGPELSGIPLTVVPFPPSANELLRVHQANSAAAPLRQEVLLFGP